MKLDQSNIREEDKSLAISVRNYIRGGNFVIGNPALGLKKTLQHLEEQNSGKEYSITDWQIDDVELETQIQLTKAGIDGETMLCDYLSRLLQYDDKLEGVIAFASLSYEQENNNLDYIPDTDVLLVYGKNILILDAKNIKVKPNQELAIEGQSIYETAKGKEILEVHSSVPIWKKVFNQRGIEIDSIDGLVCIVGKTPISIVKDGEWYHSTTKPIHIADLKETLHNWVDGKDNTLHLDILTEIAKAQIKEEKTLSIDVDKMKKMLGV